jgi:urea transporter
MGGLVAVLLGSHIGAPGDMVNSGFIGFNAVLAALATYELLGGDLRLVFLASMSTWFSPSSTPTGRRRRWRPASSSACG